MPRCQGGCNYKIGESGDLLVCDNDGCGRVKAIRSIGEHAWQILH